MLALGTTPGRSEQPQALIRFCRGRIVRSPSCHSSCGHDSHGPMNHRYRSRFVRKEFVLNRSRSVVAAFALVAALSVSPGYAQGLENTHSVSVAVGTGV